jgi:hypothetical protein
MVTVESSMQPILSTLQAADSHKISLYKGLNSCEPGLRRCRALFLPIREIVTDLVSKPLAVIESVALSIIHLFGALFSKDYTVKDSVFYLEKAVANLVDIKLSLAVIPFRYIHQVGAIAFYSEGAGCFRSYPSGCQDVSDIRDLFQDLQDNLYPQENKPCTSPLFSRCVSLFTASADVIIATLSPMLETVEGIVTIVPILFNAMIGGHSTLRSVLNVAERTHMAMADSYAAVITAPVKLVYQIFAIMYDPKSVRSIARKSERDIAMEMACEAIHVRAFTKDKITVIEKYQGYFKKMSARSIEEFLPMDIWGKFIPVEKLRKFLWLDDALSSSLGFASIFPLEIGKEPTKEEIERFQTFPGKLLQSELMKLNSLSLAWLPYASKKQIQELDLPNVMEKMLSSCGDPASPEIERFRSLPAEVFHHKSIFHDEKASFYKFLPFLSPNQIKNGALSLPEMQNLIEKVFPEKIPSTMTEEEIQKRIQSIPSKDLMAVFLSIPKRYYGYMSLELVNLIPNESVKPIWEKLQQSEEITDSLKNKFLDRLNAL